MLTYEQKNRRCFALPSARPRWTFQTEKKVRTKVLRYILSFFCKNQGNSNVCAKDDINVVQPAGLTAGKFRSFQRISIFLPCY